RGTRNAESVLPADTADYDTPANQTNSAFRVPRSALVAVAALFFAYTVFSYFYIWTTAAAWLGCLFALTLVFRPDGFRKDIRSLVAVGVGCVLALIPYAWLLSKRSETMDDVQLLVYTRTPDLWRVPEYISIVCFILIAAGVSSKFIGLRERATVFALSLAIVPILVFNQQIFTGRSLQPIHYQVFIGNYVAGLALVVTVGLLLRKCLQSPSFMPKLACTLLTLVAIGWGFVECHYTVRVLDEANIERDLALPVAKRLEQLGGDDADPHRSTVLAYDMIQSDDLPSVAPQNVLWARHQHVFAGMSWAENKERYFQFLYYSNIDERGLDYLLKNDFVAKIALFGWGRHTDRLSSEATPLSKGEIAAEVQKYGDYRNSFSLEQATKPLLSYAVINNEADNDLSKLDEWYERDSGEVIGKYTIFRLRLRK
ncbi:MAG TPA: hypothetical protein VJV05_02860, partial [Pyrinomonadaceae bacterium]|nr:hypothetical protein [Pyrinomonadaceae bacterium]